MEYKIAATNLLNTTSLNDDSFSQFSVWGGQIEVGNYTSSYIPNSGTTAGSQTTKRGDAAKYAGNFEFNSTCIF